MMSLNSRKNGRKIRNSLHALFGIEQSGLQIHFVVSYTWICEQMLYFTMMLQMLQSPITINIFRVT